MTTTYDWAKDTTTIVSAVSEELLYPLDATSFTVITTILQGSEFGGTQGIKVTNGTLDYYLITAGEEPPGFNVTQADIGMMYLAFQWSSGDHLLVPYCSEDGVLWKWCYQEDDPIWIDFEDPTLGGIIFVSSGLAQEDTVVFGSPRVLPGLTFFPTAEPGEFVLNLEEETLEPIGPIPLLPPDPVTPSEEAIVHALVGAPFGDLEFDVGKSVGWLERFVDDTFVSDVNRGDQRYWVVNWTKSFKHTYYTFTSRNYFTDPETYRHGQFQDALKHASNYPHQLVYDDNDWVIFLDAHEGLSADNRSLPDDFLIAPYQSFIYREIARANEASLDRIVFPFFIYLRHDHIQNVEQSYTFEPGEPTEHTFTVSSSCGVPYYLPYDGLTRMFKVSALREPDFDWSLLDTPVPVVDDTVKLQIVSYSYAHWNLQDVPPGETSVPPLSAENDDGWKQRCIISQVLPITGLPVGSPTDPVGTWVAPDDAETPDPAGFRGPWAPENYALKVTDPVIPFPPPPIDAEVEMVRVPMYDLVFRINMRDGVWYAADGLGNTLLVWDADLGEFVPVPAA